MSKGAAAPTQVSAWDTRFAEAFATMLFCQGRSYGRRIKCFGRLLTWSDEIAPSLLHSLVLAITARVPAPCGNELRLNLTEASALHPGAPSQLPHRDQDMEQGTIGLTEYLVTVMWPSTPYSAENGAAAIYPRSHGLHSARLDEERVPNIAELEPGDALIFLGSTLHALSDNRGDQVDRAMLVSYCVDWLPLYEDRRIAGSPAIADRFAPELARLAGYRSGPGTYQRRWLPSLLQDDSGLSSIEATATLRPDRTQLTDHHGRDDGARR
ncbi:phytanoyl-CoA dioxygenase family protein [Sphingomonas sp. BIUV-7]|uniref:Phytanoyl-CoA dioxygenase family protein n=1 Tax=Sphingomonas natans TaxID=3063330 RepID=A0ABT8YDW7_9SPHN|nr:phytanoyl-CoA dioxygenase family protein [Sphingomonas sp. BIUV-7]MDO6416142.1 phytanoyl-CoA dioxygenase family protein [Sphingomonas sp. BIUV-7]